MFAGILVLLCLIAGITSKVIWFRLCNGLPREKYIKTIFLNELYSSGVFPNAMWLTSYGKKLKFYWNVAIGLTFLSGLGLMALAALHSN